jgi:uncharacterized membrane protein AbrB (regulator of aidB expression)
MKPRLKELPSEWQKFTLATLVPGAVICWWLGRRGVLPAALAGALSIGFSLALVASLARPIWFRGFYRWGVAWGYRFAHLIGQAALALFFWLVITPLGLFLRCLGKDLLRLKRDPNAKSYWLPRRDASNLDRMF